jgi:hypothetical protein
MTRMLLVPGWLLVALPLLGAAVNEALTWLWAHYLEDDS